MKWLTFGLLLAVACQKSDEKPADSSAPILDRARPRPSAKAAVLEPGQKVPAFDAEGARFDAGGQATTTKVSSTGTARATAYVILGTHCPTTAKYLGRIGALEQAYQGKVDFVFLYPNKTDAADAKRTFHAQHKLAGPMVDDVGARISSSLLGARRTAEMILAGTDGTVVYRGAIDDSKDEERVTRKHAALAIDEHLAGKPVSLPKTSSSA